MKNMIWIAWETQRRSVELAKMLKCDLYIIEKKRPFRYLKCIFATIHVFWVKNPDVIFVQNPSMVLAAIACLYGKVFNKNIIVDRHSTFRSNLSSKFNFNYIVYIILNTYTIKIADLTIVTNSNLAKLVAKSGGKAFVLPDKIPEFTKPDTINLNGGFNILFVCSYAKDEPIIDVLEAMRALIDLDVALYISGNYKKIDPNVIESAPGNVIFTGFINEEDYLRLLFSVDAVMVLTTSDNTLMCGCYEALSALKPIITSNKDVLIDYFRGSVFVENSIRGYVMGIKEIVNNYKHYKINTLSLRKNVDAQWGTKYRIFLDHVWAIQKNKNVDN